MFGLLKAGINLLCGVGQPLKPSGIAVAASPKLWIRSASKATLPVAT